MSAAAATAPMQYRFNECAIDRPRTWRQFVEQESRAKRARIFAEDGISVSLDDCRRCIDRIVWIGELAEWADTRGPIPYTVQRTMDRYDVWRVIHAMRSPADNFTRMQQSGLHRRWSEILAE